MSPSKSFWSGIPVLAKAIGGIVTGLVGVGSLLVALGVIGNSNSNNNSPSATTVPSSGTPGASDNSGSGGDGGGVTATTSAKASFTVDRDSMSFSLLTKKATLTVTNKGPGALLMNLPQITGDKEFSVAAPTCTAAPVPAGKSCTIDVTYSGAVKASATMEVTADNASESHSVSLEGQVL
ncbi:MAG TPA: hypothetical protein VHS52_04215 [Acidimicrobiales bacterium]|nr:hypothetical protein [Acidimicrobiales bacterium]